MLQTRKMKLGEMIWSAQDRMGILWLYWSALLLLKIIEIKPGIDLNRIDNLLVNYLKSTGVDVPGKIRNRGTKVIRTLSMLNLSHSVAWLCFLKQVSPRGSLSFPWQGWRHIPMALLLEGIRVFSTTSDMKSHRWALSGLFWGSGNHLLQLKCHLSPNHMFWSIS